MMSEKTSREQVAAIALQCLQDEELLVEDPIEDYETVKLLGSNAICDSLGLVSFLVGLEEGVNEAFDAGIILMSERAMSQERSPFRNLSALIDYIVELISSDDSN
ncbi:MAG: hypothetical protein MUO76_24030 [Anaerolineaceae bacterium]|jgi:hypothetical protein|nr:hypothetical protein [Anaerolineaceae bacterium]